MVTALVMVNTQQGKVEETAQAILDVQGVREVYSVTGEYDLVALVQSKEYDQFADLITGKIAGIPTITNTHTLMAFQRFSRSDMERMWSLGDEE